MIPLRVTSALLLLALTHLATAVPPVQRRARFNCPDVAAPSWVSQTEYPRLFRFCISFDADCDCWRDRRIAGRDNYRPFCNIERQADPHDEQLQRAIRVCENSCFCYGGPTSNWERWPYRAPPETGPLLGENSGWVGNS